MGRITGLLMVALVAGLVISKKDRFLVNAEGSLSPVEWGYGEPVSKDALFGMDFGDLVVMKDGQVLILEQKTPDQTSWGMRDLRSGSADLIPFLRAELLVKGKRVVMKSDREDYNSAIGDYVRQGYRPEP